MRSIFAFDPVVIDHVVYVPCDAGAAGQKLHDFFSHPDRAIKPGDKYYCRSWDEFLEAQQLAAIFPTFTAAGGNSTNVLITMGRMFAGEADLTLCGYGGEGEYGELVRDSILGAGVNFIDAHPFGSLPKIAGSHLGQTLAIFSADSPDRRAIGWKGDLAPLIMQRAVPVDSIRQAKELLLQASLERKIGIEAFAAIPKALVEDADLHLALAKGTNRPDFMRKLLPRTSTVAANLEDLVETFETGAAGSLMGLKRVLQAHPERGGIAPITHGEKGVIALSADRHFRIPALRPEGKVNTFGGGDSFLAGFLAARLLNLFTDQECIHVGVVTATANIQEHEGATMKNPRVSLERISAKFPKDEVLNRFLQSLPTRSTTRRGRYDTMPVRMAG